jgi:hypothetical protein
MHNRSDEISQPKMHTRNVCKEASSSLATFPGSPAQRKRLPRSLQSSLHSGDKQNACETVHARSLMRSRPSSFSSTLNYAALASPKKNRAAFPVFLYAPKKVRSSPPSPLRQKTDISWQTASERVLRHVRSLLADCQDAPTASRAFGPLLHASQIRKWTDQTSGGNGAKMWEHTTVDRSS